MNVETKPIQEPTVVITPFDGRDPQKLSDEDKALYEKIEVLVSRYLIGENFKSQMKERVTHFAELSGKNFEGAFSIEKQFQKNREYEACIKQTTNSCFEVAQRVGFTVEELGKWMQFLETNPGKKSLATGHMMAMIAQAQTLELCLKLVGELPDLSPLAEDSKSSAA